MASPLSNLPEELLQHIVSEFEAHEFDGYGNTRVGKYHIYQRTLRSLLRVNKQFHRLAQPLLYKSIASIRHDRPWALRLLRTLLEQPKLADLVQNVRMEGDVFESYGKQTTSEEPGGWDPELVSAATKRVEEVSNHGSLADRILASLKNGSNSVCCDRGACMTLLLILVRNVTFLHLQTPFSWEASFTAELVENLARLSYSPDSADAKPAMLNSFLPRLKTLEVEHWDTEGSVDLGRLSNMVRIPSLEVLRGHMLSVEQHMGDLGSWPCKMKTIDLTYSMVDAPGLEILLRQFSSLQHLGIEWGDACVGDCEISWPEIGDALRKYAKSLKFLRLDCSQAFGFEDSEPPFLPLGDLRPLARLEKLAVHWTCLPGEEDEDLHFSPSNLASILPESLVELKLLDWSLKNAEEGYEGLGTRLSRLVEDKRFGALKVIGLGRIDPVREDFDYAAWYKDRLGPSGSSG
ncbi:uncharacterized protein RCC_08157 [Ramularia collo-cygni]|uniref:F-box domain-containing protein n=1 Tax=Ramularia collo-cygni TaxID=112498 RepID=A0A2D3V392_9PEZI|nr:uncharacterized protein RCC_08157 [Ramularia collo-cygni]CZT22288.1 uncharacterized protein RCC_08157 [Ramularia collo-cygni]